jgi:multicomponent Na+:H+ antiporter subunit B
LIDLLIIFLLCLTVITAAGVVRVDNLFAAVMLMGILSLLMAVVFFLLDAADVALTEAAVGAGISTVLLLSALALTTDREQRRGVRRGLALVVVLVTAVAIFLATFDKPMLGDPLAPVHLHVVPEYFRMTRELVDIPNVVTAVLAAFRGYDTLGEVIVVFTAGIGVLFLIGPDAPKGGVSPSGGDLTPEGLKHHQPLRIVGKIAIPFILLFAFYVQFHGEYSPGGGFQAGTLLAAAVILYALLEGEQRAMDVIPHGVLLGLAAGGALLYGGVGFLCMLLGGQFLQYDVLGADPVTAQQFGIIAIEAGVGMAVAGTLLLVFHAFASRDSS